jgi:hypothetical protein
MYENALALRWGVFVYGVSGYPANGEAPRGGRGRRVATEGWPGGWAAQGPLQVRPCKLGRRIHAAHAPAQPTLPATDSFRARPPRIEERRARATAPLPGSDSLSAGKRICPLFPLGRPTLLPSVTGMPRGLGRGGLAGPLAPWMAPSSPQGRVYGVSRQPTPIQPPTENSEPTNRRCCCCCCCCCFKSLPQAAPQPPLQGNLNTFGHRTSIPRPRGR